MPTVSNGLAAPLFIPNNTSLGCDFFVTGLASRPPSGMRTSASHTSGFQTSPNKSVAMFRGTNWSALSSSGIGSGNGANLSFDVFHFIAWTIPTGLTGLAILLAAVEGDSYTGLCMIGTSRRFSHILFQFAPIAMLLATGILFLTVGFIALFRIRGAIKLHRMGLHKADRLENLMIRIGVFGLLYTIPNTIVLMCIGYELQNSRAWELGLACDCKYTDTSKNGEVNMFPLQWTPPKPNPSIFLLKHFMNLFIGVTCGFWIWSHKTVESWRGPPSGMRTSASHTMDFKQARTNRLPCFAEPTGPLYQAVESGAEMEQT
ncbi:hypothetical protein AHF37_10470 [Paragonimus kellicotti]|nr:hypothetical protein AHF37_10470 [Paragonimus kellicotti]